MESDRVHHLRRVLRLSDGAPVSYTDGRGILGEGVLVGGSVKRGREVTVAPPTTRVTVAVAPPDDKTRLRFLVEKLCELGVARIRWLDTAYRQGRPPKPERASGWARAALEQSRGAYLTAVDGGLTSLVDLDRPVVVAQVGAAPLAGPYSEVTVAVGPEGGWAPGEIPGEFPTFGLGDRVLRVETAAVVAAALFLVEASCRA